MYTYIIIITAILASSHGLSTKMIKIVNEPANYGGLQSYQSNQQDAIKKPKASRKEEKFSGPLHFKALSGKCFTLSDSTYRYELCPFFNITQHEETWRWNAFQGVLGVWKEWSIVNNTFEAMIMTDGDECPRKTRRETKVLLKCGDRNNFQSVKEPSTCSYEVVFQTPLACPLDAFLVYPLLNAEAQAEWENIEKSFYHEELTKQGYKKKRDALFVRAGLKIPPKVVDNSDTSGNTSSTSVLENTLPTKKFSTKTQCELEYNKLVSKYEELRKLVMTQSVPTTHGVPSVDTMNFKNTTAHTLKTNGGTPR